MGWRVFRGGRRRSVRAGRGGRAGCTPPAPSVTRLGSNSVLAVGAGEGTSALALARNQATGETPASFTDQLAQYSGISRTADTLTASTLGRGSKNSSFRSAGQDIGSTVSPRPGVTIVRDPVHFVPRIYGDTR